METISFEMILGFTLLQELIRSHSVTDITKPYVQNFLCWKAIRTEEDTRVLTSACVFIDVANH